MVQPPENEIAAAYFRMWAANLRTTPIRDDEVADAIAMTDALQKAAESLIAGNHLTWWSSMTEAVPLAVPLPVERPPSGPHQLRALKEPHPPSSSLDG